MKIMSPDKFREYWINEWVNNRITFKELKKKIPNISGFEAIIKSILSKSST